MRISGHTLTFAVRQLRRNPGYTATVVATLALAIGANTAIFSLVDALMLRRLPYPQPDRLGTIFTRIEGPEPFNGRHMIDGAQWEQLRDHVPALVSAVSGATVSGVNLQAGPRAAYVRDGRVSQRYFEVLGVRPAVGRGFSAEEDAPHGPNAAVLGYDLWQNTFAGDPGVVGKAIQLKGEPYTVVGILPANATTPLNADLYTALKPSREGEGGGTNFAVVVRLAQGATWQQADAQVNRAWAYLAARFARQFASGVRVSYYAVPLQRGQSAALKPKALALMSAAGLILLIACANLAGFTLVRMTRRTGEIATRLALGASYWQVQRQFWTESLLLALAGGAGGVGVGLLALRGLLALLPNHYLPVTTVPLNGRVLAFTLLASLATSLLAGMLPAFAIRRVDLRSSMSRRGGWSPESARLRQALIAAEVALTVVLLAGSGLLVRTLVHLETLPAGFNPANVMTAKASLDDARYRDPAAFRSLLDRSIEAMRQIPGVESAAVGLTLPYESPLNDEVTLSDGKEAGREIGADIVYVTPSYFETLQIPLLMGRPFTASDGPTTHRVAIVNRAFARKFYRGEDPLGRTIDKDITIVGVVADVQISSNLAPVAPLESEETVYVPAAQQTSARNLALVHVWFQPSWIVRASGPTAGLTGQMQRALASVAPDLPFSGFYSMRDLEAETLATQRIEVALLLSMAGLALLLSALGIFSLVANTVAQKTREIGIRMALGSSRGGAMVQVGAPGALAAGSGLLLGLLLCAPVLRVMRSVLFGVGIYDLPTLFAVLGTLVAVTLVAAAIPALRVARIAPAQTLREE